MSGALFSIAPAAVLHVRAGAPAKGDGSDARPFAAIQDAVTRAKPGTAILVHAGTYAEAVKFPSHGGGTAEAPVWLRSADGRGAAKVVAPAGAAAAIRGLGVSHIAVEDFEVTGGTKGCIQFGMSGDPTADPSLWDKPEAWSRDILIRGNIVHHPEGRADGIKVSQTVGCDVVGNLVHHCGDQCIDFVAVLGGSIAGNDVSVPGSAAAIFAKGGSTDILIADNDVHDVPGLGVGGISLGGCSDLGPVPPANRGFEAARLTCRGNRIARVVGPPVVVWGAQDSLITGNVLDGALSRTVAMVMVGRGGAGQLPRGIAIHGNSFSAAGPALDLMWDKAKGPDGQPLIDPERDGIRASDNARAAKAA